MLHVISADLKSDTFKGDTNVKSKDTLNILAESMIIESKRSLGSWIKA